MIIKIKTTKLKHQDIHNILYNFGYNCLMINFTFDRIKS